MPPPTHGQTGLPVVLGAAKSQTHDAWGVSGHLLQQQEAAAEGLWGSLLARHARGMGLPAQLPATGPLARLSAGQKRGWGAQ